jgi:hypothetical protein
VRARKADSLNVICQTIFFLENMGSSTSRNLKVLHSLLQGQIHFTFATFLGSGEDENGLWSVDSFSEQLQWTETFYLGDDPL